MVKTVKMSKPERAKKLMETKLLYRIKTGKWIWTIARYAILVLLAYQLLYPIIYILNP